MKYKILNVLGDTFTPEAAAILEEVGTIDSKVVTEPELAEALRDYDVLFMGLYPNVSKAVMEKAPKLKVVATASTNLYHIDLDYAKERGIKVLSLQNEIEFLNKVTSTAEMAMGLLLDVMRRTPWAFDDIKKYHWDRESFRGHTLYGKTLGIVGLGRLGKWMARYGNAFNMRVIAYSPHMDSSEFKKHNAEAVDFESLLRESDVISINAHLSDETRRMFDTKAFSKMKKSVYIVNTAAGEIVDESALLHALEGNHVAGYAADVLADEMKFDENFSNHPLVEYAKSHDNLIIVPHLGGMTHEARAATDIFMAEKVRDALKTWQT